MKPQRVLLMAAAFTLFAVLEAPASDVRIVANAEVKVDSISASELKSVFLAEHTSLRDGSHVEPVFERGGAAHQAFLKNYLGRSDEALQNYYGSLVFTGKAAMPKSFRSDAEVLAYVAKTRGAIGYVSAESNADGVKTLEVTTEKAGPERALVTRVEPEYPELLKQMHIGGTVRLELTVSPKGNVEMVTLLGGNPVLAEAATKAVKGWVYAAAPSQTKLEVSIPFNPNP